MIVMNDRHGVERPWASVGSESERSLWNGSFFTQGFSQYHALCVTGILMLVVEYNDMKSGPTSIKRQCDV
jgi:hypothetical protein